MERASAAHANPRLQLAGQVLVDQAVARRQCLPRWGDLVAQPRRVAGGLDVSAFQTWALVYHGGGRSPSTVTQHVRQVRFMEREGLCWAEFLSSPAAAIDEAGRFLAPLLMDPERREAVRNYKKTLNWVAQFHASRGNKAFADLHWELPHSVRVEPRRQADDQVDAILHYRHADVVLERRRRCLGWFIIHTGLRRGEIGDIKLEDLDEARRVLLVGKPRKDGRRREVPLPDDTWDPFGPLIQWLEVRPQLVVGSWLWTTDYRGGGGARRMTGDVLYNTDLTEMSRELGFRISFTRVRHWRGRTLRKTYHQGLEIVQAAYGHSDPKTTLGYVDDVTANDMRASYQRGGVPGFRSSTPPAPAPSPGIQPAAARGFVIEGLADWARFVSGGQQKGRVATAGI